MTVLSKNLNLLKFGDVYKLELAKFMYQLHHNLSPKSLTESFVKITDIHAHNTRQAQNVVYFRPRIKKNNIAVGLKSHRGSKPWETIDKPTKDRN